MKAFAVISSNLSLRHLGVAAALASSLAAAQTHGSSNAQKLITPESVMPLIVELAGDRYAGRGGGYPGERAAAQYLAKQYETAGLTPMGDLRRTKRSFFQQFSFYPHAPTKPWQRLKSQNVLAFLEGSDPVLKNEVVVLGAHYDGQGRTGEADAGPRLIPASGAESDFIWNSANDNLTGCSAVLAVARAIKESGVHPRRSILFAAFGAEEHEVSGAMHFVNNPTVDRSRLVAMVNLECLGKVSDKPLRVNAMMTGSFWNAALKASSEDSGVKFEPNIPVPIPDSDHYPFSSARIPCVMIIGGSDGERHLPNDTAARIDYVRTADAARFALALVTNLANRDERPMFSQAPMPDLGITADLATSAECDVLHLSADEGCMRVTGIVRGRPAEEAGFRQGDAMLGYYTPDGTYTKFRRDTKLSELEAMMEAMLRGNFGKELRTVVLREGRRIDLTLPIHP